MASYTKFQYSQELAQLEGYLLTVQFEIETLCNVSDSELYTEENGNALNALYDEEYTTEQEIKFCEQRYDRRNWTAADHSTHDLIMMNMD